MMWPFAMNGLSNTEIFFKSGRVVPEIRTFNLTNKQNLQFYNIEYLTDFANPMLTGLKQR